MIHRYPLAYNPILEYWELIESGKETVSHKVRVFYEYQAKRILQPDPAAEFVYSPRRALHAIEFIEGYCRHSKGSAGGKPFLMEVWQRAFTACIFGWIDDSGFRQYQEALMIVGKKNGKSTLAAGIGLYMMVADGEPGAEVYAVATKRDQAKIIWNEASRMVKKSGYLHYTRENQRGVIRTKVGELTADYNDSVFKPLGRDSDTQDGLNVHCALLDEIHAWPPSLRDLYTIVTDGVTARDQPLILETTTAGVVREAIYDEQYDRAEKKINALEEGREVDVHFMPVVYELDDKDTWKDPEHWKEANPGLGTIKKKKQLADKVARAIANPKAVRNLLTKEFNIPETGSESWLSFSELNNQETFDIAAMRPRYGIGGTDLSSTTDLTAAVVIFRVPEDQTVYVLSMFWIPEDLVDKRTKEDQIPYDVWIKQGFMRTCAGNHVDDSDVVEWFREVQEDLDCYLFGVGYDAWSAQRWVKDMTEQFGEIMTPVPQTMKSLSAPMQQLGADLTSKLVNYDNNPVLKWCLANTGIIKDKNGNQKPVKTSNPRKRIDGLAALLDAYVVYQDHMSDYLSVI